MLLSIKHIDRLSLHDMPYLLQPYKACNAIRNVVRDTGRLDRRSLYSSDLYGLEYFIDQHIQRQQRYGFQMQYGNTFHNSLDDPISEAIQVMISRAEAFIIFSPHGLRYDPLLIPPEILEQKDQHWSLDTGIENSLSFINNPNRFKFIMEKRFRELGVAPDPETGKIISTGRSHMSWMHTHPYAYRLDEATEPTPPEPQLRPMEAMPPTYWVELKHQLNFQDDKGQIEPAAGVPFKLTLPDGKVETGKLDSNGFASYSGIKPGTCSVEYEPDIDLKIEAVQKDIQQVLDRIIQTEHEEYTVIKKELEEARVLGLNFPGSNAIARYETYKKALATGVWSGVKGIVGFAGDIVKGAGKAMYEYSLRVNPLTAPIKFKQDLANIKAANQALQQFADEDLELYASLISDDDSHAMFMQFSKDYIKAQHSLEITETGGEVVFDVGLTVITAGFGVGGSVRHLEKLKKLKPLLEKMVELLKRKRLKNNEIGPNDTTIKSTNRVRAGKGGIVGAKNADGKVTVYRVDDNTFKPRISDDGTVPVVTTKSGDERTLFINIGQPERAKQFALENRKGNATITAIDVDESLLEDLRKRSIYDKNSEVITNKTAPLEVDVNKAADQYGLRTKEDIDLFRDAVDPSTVRKIDPDDL